MPVAVARLLLPLSRSVGLLGLLAFCAAQPSDYGHAAGAPPAGPGCHLTDGETHSVVRVLDGETFVVDGGSEVRLIGALAPRAWDAAGDGRDGEGNANENWPLAALAKAALERLVTGRTVDLGFTGRRVDRYGRLLAQVFVHDPATETGTTWVQGALLKVGLARAYSLDGSAACLPELIENERVAREAATGLWAESAYTVRLAADVDHLLDRRGTFQIVEGRVRAVTDVRSSTFVNFGEDTRQDFTISLKSDTRKRLKAAGADPHDWVGHPVRVRGWVERRGGPLIEIHDAGEVELLDPDTEPGAAAPSTPDQPDRRRRVRTSRTTEPH